MKREPKVLIITSSGGGGLLQAAHAKEQEVKMQSPHAYVIRRDVMKDWVWRPFGKWCVSMYNGAQLSGNVRVQSFFWVVYPLADYIFWLPMFFYSLYTLFKEDIDRVIDTQVMGTSALLKALRFFNRKTKKSIQLEKVLVDFPTKKARHYFYSIKALSKKDRSLLKVITVAPLLENGETEEEFWRKNCNITRRELQYEYYFVRQSFRKFQHLERKEDPFFLRTRFQSEEELELIQKCLQRGSLFWEVEEDRVEFVVGPNDLLFTLLLGSQPANDATFKYVKQFLEIAKECDSDRKVHLFVFCAAHEAKKISLLRRVSDYIEGMRDYPAWFTVVPMSFQSDDVIAPLFFRSDMTCTRSGGHTAMELLCTSRGEIWIHSEARKQDGELTEEELLAGIPGWESANAVYLQQVRGAKVVTPETFAPLALQLMQQRSNVQPVRASCSS
ncbi:MAG: hypothetical protein KGJ02_05930 [Verrucomicrobiota bacterium]|nr:hypothetical protein [Verrucomicrobiota bacterium]